MQVTIAHGKQGRQTDCRYYSVVNSLPLTMRLRQGRLKMHEFLSVDISTPIVDRSPPLNLLG
jgi:hypothetical protein